MSKNPKAARELTALYRVSQAIGASLDLGAVVENILSILAEELGMQRGTLALLDPESGELAIEAAHGLTSAEKRRGRYRVGEGIMGRVLETGEPMIIPSIGAEPLFLNRTGARRDIDRSQVAFLCVPVKVENQTVGVLSADQLSGEQPDLEEDLRLLTIVAGVVAQAVRIRRMVRRETAELADQNRDLRETLEGTYRLENVRVRSPAMAAVYDQVRLLARSGAPVLISGEPGTGQEEVAKAIHFNSERAPGPFLRVSCASRPEDLLARELFGPSPDGSDEAGRCARADGGTLFLEQVGDLPPALQDRLLRVLGDGSTTARIVASTDRDLARDVREGRFREALYYRLNGVPIHLPPLRSRREDIGPLAHAVVRRLGRTHGKPVTGISAEALERLSRLDWPGNVPELEACLTRAVLGCRGEVLELGDLPAAVVGRPGPGGAAPCLEEAVAALADRLFGAPPAQGVYRTVVERVENVLVELALRRSGGVRLQAAQLLGINRNTLYAKLQRNEAS